MDETLLHSFLSPLPPPTASHDPRSVDDHEDQVAAHIPPEQRRPIDFEFEIGVGREKERVRSTLRPGLREFMHALSAEFEPILFTSAMQVYAEPLLNRIDLPPSSPDTEAATPAHLHPLWRHRIYRPGTVSLPGGWSYVKDISRLGRSMKRCVLVDNSWMAVTENIMQIEWKECEMKLWESRADSRFARSFACSASLASFPVQCVANPDNAIVVPDYLGHKDDRVLEAVLAVLRQLKDEADVRPALIKQFALREQLTKARVKLPNPSIEEQE